ncbi:MAG: hypothetical protein P8P74_17960 [Crocinitomicaceae bacterium]|nr:hypothetical protein [Crocinitomicaceae bacterium]
MKQKFTNICVLLCALIGSQFVSAQLLPIQYDTLPRSQEIILSAGGSYSGSAMQNQLFSKFIFGGMITPEIKDASDARHKGLNRVGGLFMGDVEYRNYNIKPFKKRDWGMIFKAGANAFGGGVYSDDAFGLIFYGNDRYTGETMEMSGLDMTYVSAQKVGVGIIDNKTKSNLSINLYNMNNYFSGSFRDFQITQSEDGQDVTLVMDGELMQRNSQSFSQGVGLGVDIDFKLPVAWGQDREAFIQILAKNVGMAYLHESQKYFRIDTTIQFSGLEFEDVIGDNAILSDSIDVFSELGVSSEMRNRAVLLPGFIQVGKIVDQHSPKDLQSFFGIRLYPSIIYSPFVYAGLQYKTTDWLSFGANVSYGGFTNFRGGLYANVDFDKISVGLASENIIGLVSKKGNGQSFFIRLRCAF